VRQSSHGNRSRIRRPPRQPPSSRTRRDGRLLVALADFDDRRLWLRLGYSSLFVFLHRELGLSKGASHFRKVAAELVRRFPEVVEPLRDGRLCITSVVELARVITHENRADVLPRFFHASKQEAKAVAAEIRPVYVVPARDLVTAVPASAAPAVTQPVATGASNPAEQPVAMRQAGAEVRPVELSRRTATPPPMVEPLNADARRLHVTVSKRFLEKLEVARAALSHSHPGADAEGILEAGLDLLVERAAKRKGIVSRPRSRPSEAGSTDPRFIPAAVRREVWIRDGGKCQWPTTDGGICGSTHRLQFDHVVPVARGGESTVQNLRLACAVHNDLAARQVFGDGWMDHFTRGARRSRPDGQPGELDGAS
jgi:5-methylcytosine-specific restriction endonuclease McrA